jgi:hypothetical protein
VARRPEHHPVSGGLTEARVRGPVIATDVRLDLHDPPDAPTGVVVADEARPDERAAGRQRRAGEDAPIEDAQPAG